MIFSMWFRRPRAHGPLSKLEYGMEFIAGNTPGTRLGEQWAGFFAMYRRERHWLR